MARHNLDKGYLLIAEPFLGDTNFERTVILLCEHDKNGSLGFILNQKTTFELKDVIEDVEENNDINQPLFIGGPVQQNTLHFIHRLGTQIEDSVEISEGLYWGGNYEQITRLLTLGKIQAKDIRFFLGYSGWSQGQLENELTQNSWIMSEAETTFIFDTTPDQFWRSILKKMGGKHKALANYPIDPRLN